MIVGVLNRNPKSCNKHPAMQLLLIIADTFGISSIVVLLIGLYLGIKVGKKVVSAILIVVALACACMFFFGKEPIQELLMRIEGLVA